jgi:hypothetical protein
MSEAQTIWHEVRARQRVDAQRRWHGMAIAAALLVAMTAAEVLYLTYVAGPDTVDMITAAEGMAS